MCRTFPVAVTALSGTSPVQQNVREIRDRAGKAPNLTITQGSSDPSSQAVALRGQSKPDLVLTTEAAVGLYVDNVVLPRSYGQRRNLVHAQRRELLRWPQGRVSGKNTAIVRLEHVHPGERWTYGIQISKRPAGI